MDAGIGNLLSARNCCNNIPADALNLGVDISTAMVIIQLVFNYSLQHFVEYSTLRKILSRRASFKHMDSAYG